MECILGKVGQCRAAGEDFQTSVSDDRFQAILSSSRRRQDGLHEQLLEVNHSDDVVKIHRKCVSLYSSKTLIERVTKRHIKEGIAEARSSNSLGQMIRLIKLVNILTLKCIACFVLMLHPVCCLLNIQGKYPMLVIYPPTLCVLMLISTERSTPKCF